MKTVILFVTFFISSLLTVSFAEASGSVKLIPHAVIGNSKLGAMAALDVDQAVMGPYYATLFVGVGQRPADQALENWSVMKVGVDRRVDGVSVGVGYMQSNQQTAFSDVVSSLGKDSTEKAVFGKLEYQIW